MRKVPLVIWGLLLTVLVQAQQGRADSLALLPRPAGTLFLHIDKTIYTNNETVWFSAYLLHDTAVARHQVLSVFLANNADRTIPVAEKFKMENGLAAGSLVLPDSLPPGHYLLQAYTDLLDKGGKPLVAFTAPIIIKTTTPLQPIPVKPGGAAATKQPALPIPASNRIDVRFYPEGGHLQQGISSLIAWEATTDRHAPIALSGILLKDDQPIDTVETNAYGIGRFPLQPDRNSVYTFKIKAGSYMPRDTVFTLPAPAQQGIVLHLPKAVANDSLPVTILSAAQQELHILVRHPQGVYAMFKVQVSPPQQLLRIPLYMLSKGMASITVLDGQDRPLAERLFFAHYNEQTKAVISTDQSTYQSRDSVLVRIQVKDQGGKPVQGLFSFAAVQSSRFTSDFENIEQYALLRQYTGWLPKDPSGEGLRDTAYLEDILLTKGWRKYTWQDADHRPEITASVTRKGKPLQKPVTVIAMGSPVLGMITTGNDGRFTLTREQLLIANDKKIALMVSGNSTSSYTIQVSDPFVRINEALARAAATPVFEIAGRNVAAGAGLQLEGFEKVSNLAAVTVKARRSNFGPAFKGTPGVNACGDWVDEYDFLNYPYSEKRFKPVPGKKYERRIDLNGNGLRAPFRVEPVYYTGCETENNPTALLIKGIYGEREFYGVQSDPAFPQFLSTVCWRSGVLTNAAGEAEIRFRTGDITGQFRLVVQGITNESLITGTAEVSVK
jgi:hypothetical protein